MCKSCGGNNGTLATIPGMGPYVFCTDCRRVLAPEGWYLACARCGRWVLDHVPFGGIDRPTDVCQGYVNPVVQF